MQRWRSSLTGITARWPGALLATLALLFALAALATSVPVCAMASVRSTDTAMGASLDSSASMRASAPDVSAPAGLVQASDGRVLWSRNPDKRYAPASTAKVMTALLVLRSCAGTESVSVNASATVLNGAKVGLRAGDRYSVTSLLEAMLVPSGCDAAYALAVHVAGSERAFVSLMNAEATRLGLKNTHFVNCTGLDASGGYLSARDLARITSEAMKSAEFRRIIRLRTMTLKDKTLPATNLLLAGYPGCIGGKTGTTKLAGHSIVARVLRNQTDVTAIVLGSSTDKSRYQDAARLLDWGVLHAKPGVSACFTTVLEPGDAARIRNITLAASALEGRTISAGKTASFNALVGERTAAKGYVAAPAVVGGALVRQIGGGVCQISTTLFNTALVGGYPIVARTPHSIYLSTYPLGRDATVSWGGPDLKFSNNATSTVILRALASSFSVSIGISRVGQSDYATFLTLPLTTYAPMPTKYVVDHSLPHGTTKLVVAGQPGLTTRVIRTVHRSDETTRAIDAVASTYPPIARIIAVGP